MEQNNIVVVFNGNPYDGDPVSYYVQVPLQEGEEASKVIQSIQEATEYVKKEFDTSEWEYEDVINEIFDTMKRSYEFVFPVAEFQL